VGGRVSGVDLAVFVEGNVGGGDCGIEHADQLTRGEHIAQRRQAFVAGGEAGAAEATALRYMDGIDGGGGNAMPGAEALQNLAAAGRKREDAAVGA